MKTVYLYGDLAKKYGKKRTLAVETVSEAINAMCYLYPGFKKDFISNEDYAIFTGSLKNPQELSLQELTYINTSDSFHIYPIVSGAANGQKRRGFLKVLAAAAILVVGIATQNVALTKTGFNALSKAGSAAILASQALFFSGIGLLLSPQINPNSDEVKSQNYLFGDVGNTIERGQPVPLVYGECLAQGFPISQEIDTSYAVPPVDIYTPPTLGPGGSFNWSGNYYDNVYGAGGGGKSGGGSSGGREDPNTLQTKSRARLIDLYSEGPIEGFSTTDPAQSIYMQGVPLKDINDNFNYQGVSFVYRPGLPDQDHIPGFDGAVNTVNVEQQVTVVNPVSVGVTGNFDAVKVTVAVPALNQLNTSTGNLTGTNLSYAIEYRTATGSWVTAYTENLINEKTVDRWERDYRVNLPPGGSPYSIRVRRITADSSVTTLNNSTIFARYSTIIDGKYSYRNSAVVGLEFDAKQFGSNVPQRQAKLKGLRVWVPKNYDPVTRTYATTGPGTSSGTWDGTFKLAYTDNPAWVFYDLLINDRYGLGKDFWKVTTGLEYSQGPTNAVPDKWALYSIAQRCDGLVSNGRGGQEPRYRIGIQITSRQEAFNLLQSIASVFEGMIYYSDGKLVVVDDRPDTPSFLLNQTDVLDGLFDRQGVSLKGLHSAALVYWNDPNNLDRREMEVYEDPELIDELGYNPTEIQIFGCRSRMQAIRKARWALRSEKTQSELITTTVGIKGAVIFPGMVGKIFDPAKAGARYAGKIKSVTQGAGTTTFLLDASVTLPAGVSTISFLDTSANVVRLNIQQSNGTFSSVTTSTFTNILGEFVSYVIETPNLSGELVRVVSVTESEEGFSITMIPYDANKFAFIEEGITLPDDQTSVISPNRPPAISSVKIEDYYIERPGTQPIACVQISYTPANAATVANYEVELQTPSNPFRQVYFGINNSVSVQDIEYTPFESVKARVRYYDVLGRPSEWVESNTIAIDGINGIWALNPPTGISLTPIVNGFQVRWNSPPRPDVRHIEVFSSTTNNVNTATKVAEIKDNLYTVANIIDDNTYYFWLRTVVNNSAFNISSGQVEVLTSAFSSPVFGVRGKVGANDITFSPGGIQVVSSLPTTGNFQGRVVFLSTDNRLYKFNGTEWEPVVQSADLVGQIVAAQIADGQLNTAKFAAGLRPVEIVSTLPTTGNTQGRMVFLTTDNKLYRFNGTTFTAQVPTGDLTGQITTTQITDNAITTAKIQAGAITTNRIQSGAITSNEIAANTIVAGNIATGAITATQIASNAITSDKINANAVTAGKIAANAIVASNIQAGTITGDRIAANTITAGQIAALTIEAANIRAGAIETNKIIIAGVTNDRLAENAASNFVSSERSDFIFVGAGTVFDYLGVNITTRRPSSRILVGGYIRISCAGSSDSVGIQVIINGNVEAELGMVQRDTNGNFIQTPLGPIDRTSAAAGSYNVGFRVVGLSGFNSSVQGGLIWALAMDV